MKNPFDGGFKSLAEDHPELLLRLLGIVAPGAKTRITSLLRELQLNAVQIDHAYVLDDASIVHFEAISNWDARRVGRLGLYRFLLRQKYRVPVVSYVVLMAEKHAPTELPELLSYDDGDGLWVQTVYKAVRLWEIDPAIAFEPDGQPLLPWVPLLKGGAADFQRAAGAIEYLFANRNPLYDPILLTSQLASLAGLRYDKEAIRQFLQRLLRKNMIPLDVFKVSCFYQEGKAEGEINGKRAVLRLMLRRKFPGEEFPEIDQIHQAEALDGVVSAAIDAEDVEQVRGAILAVIRPQ